MIMIEVQYKTRIRMVKVYHRWDLTEDEICDRPIWEYTKADIGKYYPFDDGSGWYSQIIGVTPTALRTKLCVIRKEDYIHRALLNYPNTPYSGVLRSEEHPLIRKFSPGEDKVCRLMMKGEKEMKTMTPRVKMLTFEKLRERLEVKGIDDEFIVDALVNAASKGNEKMKAISTLANIMGVDITPTKKIENKNVNFNNLTIQDQRRQGMIGRMPNSKEIANVVAKVEKLNNGN